ncbi:MAG: hypothetical protein PVJ67_01830 [Candidatus Pacearchaeota archaeon]|jgi:hypothetical protein
MKPEYFYKLTISNFDEENNRITYETTEAITFNDPTDGDVGLEEFLRNNLIDRIRADPSVLPITGRLGFLRRELINQQTQNFKRQIYD